MTNFQFTAHTSKIGGQDKFMSFSGLVAIIMLLLFVCCSLRHARLFKLEFPYCFSKDRRYLDIFMVWRFGVKEIGETQALPLAFLCIFTMCLLEAAHICRPKLVETKDQRRPASFLYIFWCRTLSFHVCEFIQWHHEHLILLRLCLESYSCLLSFERNETHLDWVLPGKSNPIVKIQFYI